MSVVHVLCFTPSRLTQCAVWSSVTRIIFIVLAAPPVVSVCRNMLLFCLCYCPICYILPTHTIALTYLPTYHAGDSFVSIDVMNLPVILVSSWYPHHRHPCLSLCMHILCPACGTYLLSAFFTCLTNNCSTPSLLLLCGG